MPVLRRPGDGTAGRGIEMEQTNASGLTRAGVDGLAGGGSTEAPDVPALAPVGDEPGQQSGGDGPPLTARSPSGAVLLAYLARQVDRVKAQDPRVRRDAADSVHQMRVATRRLRSALTTFDALFDARVTRPLRAQLKWLAGELGAARDAEVMRNRLRAAVESESREMAVRVGAEDLLPEFAEAYRTAHDRVLADLDSARYLELLAMLEDLVERPPVRERGEQPAGTVLPALVHRGYGRVRGAVKAARATPEGPERDELLHDARKAAKQARYAGEVVEPVFGADATRFAAAMENVQEALGERQDALLTRERLHALARSTSSTEVAFLCGRLHAREDTRLQESQDHFEAAWKAAGRASVLGWLR
jgi:CHAD domain-containing protein